MHKAIRWSLWMAAALPAAPASAQPVTTEVETVQGPDTPHADPAQSLAFKVDRYDRMTIPVLVGGRGPYRFLVDTGADRTAISTALAAGLNLAEGPTAILHSVAGTSRVRTATVPRLEVSPDRVRSVEAPLLEAVNMGADGILGVDSLRSQKVLFDFKRQTISIVPSLRMPEERGTIVVRGKLKRGHLIVTKATINRQPMTVVLDTGSEMTIGNSALRRRLQESGRLGEGEAIQMTSVTGDKLNGEVFFVKRFTIGDVAFTNLGIVFADAQIFRTLGLEDRPTALLGMNALRSFDKVAIDFAKKQLRMVVPEESSLRPEMLASR